MTSVLHLLIKHATVVSGHVAVAIMECPWLYIKYERHRANYGFYLKDSRDYDSISYTLIKS